VSLAWPAGWPRTHPKNRERARFDPNLTLNAAIKECMDQVRLMGASELRIEADNILVGGAHDPGVVVYFKWRGKSYAWPCDHWDKPQHNLRAISKTLDAKRAVERWRATSLEREFKANLSLGAGSPASPPAAKAEAEFNELLSKGKTVDEAYKELALKHHPDRKGSHEAMSKLNELRELYA
jgi:hypothetical protein